MDLTFAEVFVSGQGLTRVSANGSASTSYCSTVSKYSFVFDAITQTDVTLTGTTAKTSVTLRNFVTNVVLARIANKQAGNADVNVGVTISLSPGRYSINGDANPQTQPIDQSNEAYGPAQSFDFTLQFAGAIPTASVGNVSHAEGNSGTTDFIFPVTLSASTSSNVTLNYTTVDGTATTSDNDYQAQSGTLVIPAGQTSGQIVIKVVGDNKPEPDEFFTVRLTSVSSNASLGLAIGTGTILNDDASVDFDWTVPERFGFDKNGDSLIDYYPPDGSMVINPVRWRVDFTYTMGGLCRAGLTQKWSIDGQEVLQGDPGIIVFDPNACKFSYGFLKEGKYQIQLELKDGTSAVLGQKGKDVVVQDWLIVSLGDSVASGEGNADIPGIPVWENRQCHRSASAGPAQAALAIERADPKTSVTFIHLACSGATIWQGILGGYVGQEPGATLSPQIDVMASLVGNREVDAVLISIGANDVEFSTIVQNCFVHTDCNLESSPGSALLFFNRKLPQLGPSYDALANQLKFGLSKPVKAERTYITEYFDPTRDQNGAFCDYKILQDAGNWPDGFGISAAEAQWASTDMLTRLNGAVSAAAARSGWRYVSGIYDAFRTHGYCASPGQRWIVQVTESLADQGNKDGTIHPNEPGHALYASRIAGSLRADFYQNSDLTKPREPLSSP